jgi:tRNA uridine 5-carboxymethylaminomethyl modification enzyme
LRSFKISPRPEIHQWLSRYGSVPLKQPCSLFEIMKRPEIDYAALESAQLAAPGIDPEVSHQVETLAKYEGYIQRQQQMVEKFRHLEAWAIPPDMRYDGISGLSTEVKHKLHQVRPVSLGQASRIAGITPAALSILMVLLKKRSDS